MKPILPIFVLAGLAAHGAPITWGLPANTSGKSDLIEGSIVHALNGGDATLTINDGGASGNRSYIFLPSDYTTIDFTPTGEDAADSARVGIGLNQYAPELIATTGDEFFDALISTTAYAFGTPTGIVTGDMLLDDLTVGTEYQIQVFFNDQRSPGTDSRAMTFGDGEGNTVLIAAGDPTDGVQVDHYGQFAVGTFTADATSQLLTMDSSMGTTPFGNVHYNAILVTGPEELNVRPQLDDVSIDLADGTPAGTLVTTLMATDGNAEDTLSYSIISGDPENVFTLDPDDGELRTNVAINAVDSVLYDLTVEVSDTVETSSASVEINVIVPTGTAAVTWSPAQNTSSVADLVPGAAVFAANGGATDLTVAGTVFETLNLGNGFSTAYGAGGIFSTGDADFDALISEFSFGGGAGVVDLPGNITGLTPGRLYTVQVFFNEQRPAQSSRVMTFGDGNGNTVDVAAGATLGTGESDDYGQFAIGTFTANSTSQILQLNPGGAGFGNSHFNAILVVEGGGSLSAPEVTEIEFNAGTNEVTLTWTSDPGRFYNIVSSTNLTDFDVTIGDSVPASGEGNSTTETFVLPAGLVGADRLFFRVEAN